MVATDGPFGGAAPNLETDRRAGEAQAAAAAGEPAWCRSCPASWGRLRGGLDHPGGGHPGRGGSDLTATLLGRALGASKVCLWKDVPGLLTADPRVVPDARVIPQLNVREAAELAYYGAKVLHPRALIPVTGKNIPVCVRPFATPDAPGTEISARRDPGPLSGQGAVGGARRRPWSRWPGAA